MIAVDPPDIAPARTRLFLKDRLDIRYEYKLTAELHLPFDLKFTILYSKRVKSPEIKFLIVYKRIYKKHI